MFECSKLAIASKRLTPFIEVHIYLHASMGACVVRCVCAYIFRYVDLEVPIYFLLERIVFVCVI